MISTVYQTLDKRYPVGVKLIIIGNLLPLDVEVGFRHNNMRFTYETEVNSCISFIGLNITHDYCPCFNRSWRER